MSYMCGPTAVGSRASWAPLSSPVTEKTFTRPLSGNFDRIFNAFERTNAFEYVKSPSVDKEERHIGHGDIVVNRKMSSSFERADCALAAQTPCSEDEDFYREKILYSQARQLFPLQEDLADWINKTIGITYLNGENFLDVLDNGVELCQLAAVIHDRAKEAVDQGLIVGPVPAIRGRCWQRAARRSFFSRDNTENFITFCRDLGVHENLLFESDDLVLHNQPRQVILCLLEVARLATRFGVEPPGLVALEREIALEERDSGLDSAMSSVGWQFRGHSPIASTAPALHNTSITLPPSSPPNKCEMSSVVDNTDAESTKSEGTVDSTDSDVPLKPTNELDKRVQLVTRLLERGCSCAEGKCSRLLKVKKVGEGRYNIAGRNVFIRLLKGRHMMVRVGGGWDTLEHFLSRHEPCQVRLVTPGRRDLLPVPLSPPADPAPAPLSRKPSLASLASSKTSLASKEPSLPGSVSPVDGKASSLGGKLSPIEGPEPRKNSPAGGRRTSTPAKVTGRARSALTLPLKADHVDGRQQKPAPRGQRKQSAPNIGLVTPRSARTPPEPRRAPLLTDAPKKSRSMSLAFVNRDEKKPFCGTDRLNQARAGGVGGDRRSSSAASTPTQPNAPNMSRKTRSQSLATTPVAETRRFSASNGAVLGLNGFAKKTRSMSLATPGLAAAAMEPRPLSRGTSASAGGALTQAAIEESVRQSLASSVADGLSPKKPFLHIKAKYRSPPPREVPPR